MRMNTVALRALVLCTVVAVTGGHASEPLTPAARFVSQLSTKNGHLIWQNIRLGQSQREVEKLLGTKISVKPSAHIGSEAMTYTHETIVVRDGLRVRLGFARQGAQNYLQVVEPESLTISNGQVASLRKAAKIQLKGLRDSGAELPLATAGGEELDINEHALRLQAGSDGE